MTDHDATHPDALLARLILSGFLNRVALLEAYKEAKPSASATRYAQSPTVRGDARTRQLMARRGVASGAGSKGSRAKKHVQDALWKLEKYGAIYRQEGQVVVTDRPLLERVAKGDAPWWDNAFG